MRVGRDRSIRCREAAVAELGEPVERDLDVRRRQVFREPLRFAIGPAGRARERVARAQRVEDLAADAAGGICSERRAEVTAIALRRLDKTNDPRRDEVLAVGTATPRIECPRRDGSREAKVRDDPLVDFAGIHLATAGRVESARLVSADRRA